MEAEAEVEEEEESEEEEDSSSASRLECPPQAARNKATSAAKSAARQMRMGKRFMEGSNFGNRGFG